jgi:hypothetical protein
MIKSVVIKSSDFMKESENVSDEGIAAIVKIRKDIFFSRRIYPRAVRQYDL